MAKQKLDQTLFLGGGFLVFFGILFYFFRHIGHVSLCLVSVLPAYLCTLALMGAAGMANSFVPKSDKVIAYTPLVLTGNTYKLYFKAPTNPGKYEYICTYPGHGLTMWGILHVK